MRTWPPTTRQDSPRAFLRLWTSAGVANLGDGMGKIAVPLLATQLTDKAAIIGGLTAMTFLPYLLLGVPVGVIADRFERRRVMICANLLRGFLLAATSLAVVNHAVSIGWLFMLVFVLGATECCYDAAADGAVPQLVEPHRLDWANSRLQGTVTTANEFLGGPVGARLFAAGAVYPFAAQAAGFLLTIALIATLPKLSPTAGHAEVAAGAGRPLPAPGSALSAAAAARPGGGVREAISVLWADSIEGVRWLSSHPTLRGVALVTATCGMAIEMAQGTLVLFALRELRLPISSFGLFASSLAVGSLVGTLLAPRLVARFGRTATMTGALAILPLFLAAVGLSPGVFTAAAALACFAGAVGLWNVLSISLRQALTPNAMYGRVHGAWRALVWGSLPIGAATGGLIADHLGLRAPWLLAAAVFVVTAGCAVVVLHRARDEINQLRRPAPVAVG